MTPPVPSGASLFVLFAGVGGQGTLTAARLLGEAFHRRGDPVVISQLHGMSQRGGSVQATTVVGTADVLPPGRSRTDILIGFELLEAVRVSERLDSHSVAICNRWVVAPPLATATRSPVPTEPALCAELEARAGQLHLVNGMSLLAQAGARAQSINVLMLGALSGLAICPLEPGELLETIRDATPAVHWQLNKRLFALGQQAVPQPPAKVNQPSPNSNARSTV